MCSPAHQLLCNTAGASGVRAEHARGSARQAGSCSGHYRGMYVKAMQCCIVYPAYAMWNTTGQTQPGTQHFRYMQRTLEKQTLAGVHRPYDFP